MFRNVTLVGAALSLLFLSSIVLAQDTKSESSYQLSYKFKEGEKWLEVVTLNQLSSSDDETMGAMLKSDSNREVSYRNEVKSVDKDGTASLLVIVERIKLKSTQGGATIVDYDSEKDKGKEKSTIPMVQQMIAEIDKSIGAKFVVKIDNSGKVLEAKAEGGANPEFAHVPRIVLPNGALKKGDKWDYESSLSQVNPVMSSVKINCVLDSIEDGAAVIKSDIAVTGKSWEEIKGSDSKGSGTFYFNTKDGKMTKMAFTLDYENTISNSMLPKDVKVNMKAGLTVEYKPAGTGEVKKDKGNFSL